MQRIETGRAGSIGAVALCILMFLVIACGSPQSPPTQTQKAKDNVQPGTSPSLVKHPDIGFASRQKLVDHYHKHGREFGAITMEKYLSGAQELRDRPAGGTILENERPDGTITRFDRLSGDFIAFNKNGIIRTYFRPADGEAYYERQLRRRQ